MRRLGAVVGTDPDSDGDEVKRLTPLPSSARRADPDRLRTRKASLAAQRKNTAAVHREHVLAVAMKIRRELRHV